ncbi:DNA polymerase III subunit delta [Prochlorococcus sp. MIT 1307]|uniref:DNA polymerase III subunit delta n=1 Tax=Prochlorococcus sp. MIT 1307 TaxID=3096219 RepID=UPI002A74E9D1|nr:DNA polymerase III subunit delta [Prochlorococcus sp. MIT 1307]
MPIHLVWGDDSAASDRAVEALIQKIIDPVWTSVNLSRLDGSDNLQASQALEEVRTPPFGNGGRVILVKRSPFCNGCSSDLAKSFEEILELVPSKTHLILSNTNKPDGRLKATKALQALIKKNQAFEKSFVLPAIWDGAGKTKLVERTAKELDITLTTEATALLVEAIGNDSGKLTSELKKLSILADTRKNKTNTHQQKAYITADIVQALIEGMATNALQIGDSLLADNIGEALERLNALLDKGEPALRILATLTSQVRGWLWVSLLEKQGEKDVGVIAKAAGIANPKRIYVMRKQLQGKLPNRFLELLGCLLDIEAALKKGILPADAFKEGLLSDNCFK